MWKWEAEHLFEYVVEMSHRNNRHPLLLTLIQIKTVAEVVRHRPTHLLPSIPPSYSILMHASTGNSRMIALLDMEEWEEQQEHPVHAVVPESYGACTARNLVHMCEGFLPSVFDPPSRCLVPRLVPRLRLLPPDESPLPSFPKLHESV